MEMPPESHVVRETYDRLAGSYDRRWRPYIDATMQAVLENGDFDQGKKILDVPCGTGELERRLLASWPDLQITGVDLSPRMLAQARAKDGQDRVRWIEADVHDLPLAEGQYDCVICANSFHYFRDPRQSLQELRRVLRPGGTLLLVDWCDDYLTCKLCSLWLRWTDPAFFRSYSLPDCRGLLEESGLSIERAERFRINWLWGLMRFVCRKIQ